MLHEFLEKYRAEILALAEEKTLNLAGSLSSSVELQRGLPLFFEHLIEALKHTNTPLNSKSIAASAAVHGKELLRLDYTLSHVVHAYGAMCQAITELAQRRDAKISAKDFNDLNMCLDVAIAAAVSEFQFRSVLLSQEREVEHLGFLVHELRNALSSASVANEMIKLGIVGTGGSTAKVLAANLDRMRLLIDRSLSEVRMRADPEVHIENFPLNVLVDQILITAQNQARTKQQSLKSDVKSDIDLETDRQLLLSAIANLIQNALKYTKNGGSILVRAAMAGSNVVIEIEDECGGVPDQIAKTLFKPFVSGGFDQSGLGLGMAIVQRAVNLLQGNLTFRNSPGHGCTFQIEVPQKLVPKPRRREVSGENSAQPKKTK